MLTALEGLWSASSVPGTQGAADRFECASCNMIFPNSKDYLKQHIFMIVVQGFGDPYTLDLKALMKCCVGELVPDGRMIPFCAYNSVGYREQVRAAMMEQGAGNGGEARGGEIGTLMVNKKSKGS